MANEGREVSAIYWPDEEASRVIYPNAHAHHAVYSTENHGDHICAWIVEYNAKDDEIRRHNARYLETIEWA